MLDDLGQEAMSAVAERSHVEILPETPLAPDTVSVTMPARSRRCAEQLKSERPLINRQTRSAGGPGAAGASAAEGAIQGLQPEQFPFDLGEMALDESPRSPVADEPERSPCLASTFSGRLCCTWSHVLSRRTHI